MRKIAIIGECMIELNGELFGEMTQSYGGDTLNTATYLSRISLPDQIQTYYVSALGRDKLSQMMNDAWQTDGINTDLVLVDEQRQPSVYLIQVDEQGERSFLYWRKDSAATHLVQHPDFPLVIQKLASMDMIYLSGISLAILPQMDRDILIAHLSELKTQGVKIAFDTNYRPKLWNNEQETKSCYTKILALTDLALVTFEDEQKLWGDRDITESLAHLTQFNIETVVVKDGKNGAAYLQDGELHFVPTSVVENVVDTTSAGDSFNAGFLNGYLQNKSLEQCCQQGNQLAAIVIQHKGAIIPLNATQHLHSFFNS